MGPIPGRGGRRLHSRGLAVTGAFVALVALVALVATLAALAPSAARADSGVTVDAACTLPLAVAYADGSAEPACASGTASGITTINLPAGTYTLASTLSLTANTTIAGAGASSTTISGGDAVTVLSVAPRVTASVSGVTITGGLSGVSAQNGLNGGGVANAGTLTLTNTVITANLTSGGVSPTPTPDCFIDMSAYTCLPSAGQSGGDGGNGGGIYNSDTLTVDNSTVSNNGTGGGGDGSSGVSGTNSYSSAGQDGGYGGSGGNGAGIDNDSGATLAVVDSTITGNTAGAGGSGASGSNAMLNNANGGNGGGGNAGGEGGGIDNSGTFSASGSTIADNATGAGGTGADAGSGMGSGTDGSAGYGGYGGYGGGIYTSSATTDPLTNVTIARNATGAAGAGGSGAPAGDNGNGGGIWHTGAGSVMQLSFVTIADNSAIGTAGGIGSSGGVITEADSVVAANAGAPAENCTTSDITDDGNDVVFGDHSCPGTYGDPVLGALQDNGGPTQTLGLNPGSAALNEVPPNACPTLVDQRGVSRPQGAGCDAGAYEVAPPAVGGVSGSSSSSTGATVTASINPNGSHADTTVIVEYGTGTGYGTATASQDIGRGIGPVSFSAALSDLQAATTYHFAIVATNADGTTTTSDGTFATAAAAAAATPALTAMIRSLTRSGSTLKLHIACSGGDPDGTCNGTLTLTTHVSTRGKRIIAISAEAAAPRAKPKNVSRIETVGSGGYSVTTGHSKVIRLKLNATGLKLLAARYRLPATLSMRGTDTNTRTVTFRYGVISSPIASSWSYGPHLTTATKLTLTAIPAGSAVLVRCHGGGCPFARHSFAVKKGKVDLTSSFKRSKLRSGATVAIDVTHTGDVGEVATFTMQAGANPTLATSCFVPGARTPSVCLR